MWVLSNRIESESGFFRRRRIESNPNWEFLKKVESNRIEYKLCRIESNPNWDFLILFGLWLEIVGSNFFWTRTRIRTRSIELFRIRTRTRPIELFGPGPGWLNLPGPGPGPGLFILSKMYVFFQNFFQIWSWASVCRYRMLLFDYLSEN